MITLYTKPLIVNHKHFPCRGRLILTNKWRDTKTALALETRSQWHTEPLSTPLAVTLRQYFGDKHRRDVDAYIKIILDSMEGIVYDNDCQIQRLMAEKFYDKDNPRTEVEITKLVEDML